MIPAHHVALRDGWGMWRWTALRGAGFPVRLVAALAAPELVVSADALDVAQAAAERVRLALEDGCEAVLREQGSEQARWARRAVRRLRQHAVPDEPLPAAALEALRDDFVRALAAVADARRIVGEVYEQARVATSTWLRTCAADDRFARAVLWQNRRAVATGIAALLRAPVTATDTKTRQNERLVASYLQRYCAKNDTIGFFGPVGWARFADSDDALVQRPGRTLEARRQVYFEYWAIDALAQALAEDPAIRLHLAPRLLPMFRVDGTTLHHGAQANELPETFALVAAGCDGERTPAQLADALGLDISELCEILGELVDAKVITWTLEIPPATAYPEQVLAAALARIGESAAIGALERLLACRDAIAGADSAPALDAALVRLEETFTELTGALAQREGGKTYAGRTLAYEDCRRDTEVVLGAPVVARLAAPLALVLASARWFTYEIARRYLTAARALYAELAPAGGAIDYVRFWRAAVALFPGPQAGIVAEVRTELQRRWSEIVGLADTAIVRQPGELASAVQRAFAAPGPGWPAARHQSPDVLLVARGPGDFGFVLGELHAGFNTFTPLFVKEHPEPAQVVADRDADLAHVGIAPVWSKAITRADYYSPSPSDLDLETGVTRSARPRARVIALSALTLAEEAGELVVRTRDGAHRFSLIEILEHHLIAESFSAFSLLPPAPHTPRVTIGDLVVARESWRISPGELAWPAIDDAAERFVAARRWAGALGLPRCIFVKTPEETKPTYVDFTSPIYIDLLAKSLRTASAATLSEMLPALDETWLADAQGERYTAELRIVAVDPLSWSSEQGVDDVVRDGERRGQPR